MYHICPAESQIQLLAGKASDDGDVAARRSARRAAAASLATPSSPASAAWISADDRVAAERRLDLAEAGDHAAGLAGERQRAERRVGEAARSTRSARSGLNLDRAVEGRGRTDCLRSAVRDAVRPRPSPRRRGREGGGGDRGRPRRPARRRSGSARPTGSACARDDAGPLGRLVRGGATRGFHHHATGACGGGFLGRSRPSAGGRSASVIQPALTRACHDHRLGVGARQVEAVERAGDGASLSPSLRSIQPTSSSGIAAGEILDRLDARPCRARPAWRW